VSLAGAGEVTGRDDAGGPDLAGHSRDELPGVLAELVIRGLARVRGVVPAARRRDEAPLLIRVDVNDLEKKKQLWASVRGTRFRPGTRLRVEDHAGNHVATEVVGMYLRLRVVTGTYTPAKGTADD
jgi:hypothetical protein